ncbi:MAG TPA: ATP-dependent zinc metalloprotease FtsH [Gemmatimonadaceae bacterium]|nr:ATP-dependent zinc metalloprotease FtsH [Gemmatimonadaceae bacterium]
MEQLRRKQFRFSGAYLLAALVVLSLLQFFAVRAPRPRAVPYSDFLAQLRAGNVKEVRLASDRILAELKSIPDSLRPTPAELRRVRDTAAFRTISTDRLPGVEESYLIEEMQSRGVVFSGRAARDSVWRQFLLGGLPFLLMIGLYFWAMTRMQRRGGPLSFGKSTAKIYDKNEGERVTFADVAGVEEAKAELVEVVGFLKDPTRYRALGARIPKGVLLVGSPGTGKTLLARAVAGEANVPFFSLSGSEFVEMFVGVGAARMRALFEQAKERAPCIIFIDELDAIGKSRGGAAAFATHDEREQTLNQLLVEMDGFDPGKGVIIMGATNRPEVLDQALLRAGRFDRQVLVDRPTVEGRVAILQVHARRVKLAPEVRLETVAQRTAGMVGADLANVVNEAALAAGRRNAASVTQADFEEAIDRIQLGLKRRGRVMNEEEKRRVAVHEGGHALVALSVEHADPVHRVTIIPRSIGALGATLQLPTEDRYLLTRGELRDRLCVMLGGRAAEEIALDDISTGAHNDLERASETARQMVTRFGMTDELGPVTYGRATSARFLQTPVDLGEERNYSEETARAIDAAVRAMVDAEHERARRILEERRDVLDRIAQLLLERETVERVELEALVAAHEARGNGRGAERTRLGTAKP